MEIDRTRRLLVMGSLSTLGLGAVPAFAQAGLALPLGTLVLTRTIVRDLADGKQIVVERAWQVSFAHQLPGILVTGRQISAAVDAPPALAELAAIEQRRDTDAMFPIRLSGDGLIEHVGMFEQPADIDAALQSALKMVARLPIGDDERARMRQTLSQLAAAGGSMIDSLPPDLFFPRSEAVHDRRQIGLPDGSLGEFELTYRAVPAQGGPWLANSERQVLTRYAGQTRHSRESWSLRSA